MNDFLGLLEYIREELKAVPEEYTVYHDISKLDKIVHSVVELSFAKVTFTFVLKNGVWVCTRTIYVYH